MERGSYCYFCGTQLVRVAGDPFGACYECFKCPPVTHWRWNEDTEFLQLYVAGERCPYCNLQVPESSAQAPAQPERRTAAAPAPASRAAVMETPSNGESKDLQSKKPGKPVTVNDVWWASVVEWCRANNGHDTRKHHNCSKELARMQARGEVVVEWHNRDRIPGTGELITSGR